MNGPQQARIIYALGTVPPEKLTPKFKEIALACMLETMDSEGRANIIFALATVLNENLSEAFQSAIPSEISNDMNGVQRALIICAFGKLEAGKWEDLKKMASSFFTPK